MQQGKGNKCHYFFPVGEKLYTGLSASDETGYGQTVLVYYDAKRPWVNSLEDYNKQSRTSLYFVYFSSSILLVLIAYLVWNGPSFKNS